MRARGGAGASVGERWPTRASRLACECARGTRIRCRTHSRDIVPHPQVNPAGLKYMKPHQRVNKFPKASALTLKANLWTNYARSEQASPRAHPLREAARGWHGPELFPAGSTAT